MSDEPAGEPEDERRHLGRSEGECPDGCWGCAAQRYGAEDFVGPVVQVSK